MEERRPGIRALQTLMKIHEYQGKELLKKFGVPVPRGIVARTPDEAFTAAQELATVPVVVKAQIHAGGRGKGGGVKLAKSPEEAREIAQKMLGMKLVTHQTGPEGREVRVLLIEEGLPIDREFYLGLVLDRASGRPVFMASAAGGMDIEEVAAKTPEQIFKETVDPAIGFRAFQARKLAFALGLPGALVAQAAKFMQSLYAAYEAMDASLLEINPFLLTKDNRLIALDAKVNFDDNALFRHPDFKDLRDLNEEEPLEIEASKFDLNYIKLDGNIACMVNGAGLAMATMDIIKLAGGEPANFLDVGGGASQERVEAAFRILLADPHVKAVLINIFGGIVRCDMVARGVVGAANNLGVQVPVVVRLEGTNVEEGQRVIRESGLNFTVANGMKDAAEKVVSLAG
jgi:succinyl-CoA synthetase beta subunit